MGKVELGSEDRRIVEQALGYLNFSSGSTDPRFLGSLNRVFEIVSPAPEGGETWRAAWDLLDSSLQALHRDSAAFHDTGQAAKVLQLVRDHAVPGYLQYHRDLLFHQSAEKLCNSLFLGRVCEALLREGVDAGDGERLRSAVVRRLNDYIGHRPVAALESRKIEPYPHEWVRPVPLYVAGAGVAIGPYREVVEIALQLLRQTDEEILRESCFDPDRLEELAFDPRAYDFDHPVNKRPNYHFGQWDPHRIDNAGGYRRFVIQQVTLDALHQRLDGSEDLPRDELLFEAAAVMAGTVIMSSGVSGAGPDAHDSSVTLATLLPRIAAYRDAFYERLLATLKGAHGQRLKREAEKRKQPFGGARQHLNAALARRRAAQLEHVHLAAIYARMGSTRAAVQQAAVIPAASARMLCQIECRLTAIDQSLASGDLDRGARLLDEAFQWLQRGIACGAIVDPWNILGFDANFSLFPAVENSVRDHRVDELIALVEQMMAMYARLWSEAAARDDAELCPRVASRFRELVGWWRKYAAHEVSSVDAVDPEHAYLAAERVAEALNLWHKGGAAVEDVRFWAPHADMFDSPKAYGLVVQALLEREGFVASRALLMHWLSQASRIGLEQGDTSFSEMAEQWMLALCRREPGGAQGGSGKDRHEGGQEACGRDGAEASVGEPWSLACKFLDYLEANAGEYWQPPQFELGPRPASRDPGSPLESKPGEEEEEDDASAGQLFGAAYEDVVYRDSTDDGVDGELFEQGSVSDDAMLAESRRLGERLSFLSSVARLWQLAVAVGLTRGVSGEGFCATLRSWREQAERHRRSLRELLHAVSAFPLPEAEGHQESMVEYDRVRLIKESILEMVITTSVDMADASRVLASAAHDGPAGCEDAGELLADGGAGVQAALSALLRGDASAFSAAWPDLRRWLLERPLLYVPLAKGGNPHAIVAAKCLQRLLQDMLSWMPRLGLIDESCQLIETAREMERLHSVGPGAVTEFDEMFKIGYKALVRLIVESSGHWQVARTADASHTLELTLVECIKQLTESLLPSWLAHSKTLRLSVLEKVRDRAGWDALVSFVERYGADLFTQRFLNLANLRAILHQGVEAWLRHLAAADQPDVGAHLIDDLERERMTYEGAAEQLTLVLEAVVENYGEYRDYNSMTTQSDRGELLYMLLDFLRLRTVYDRVCWQFKPVVWAHEILVRGGKYTASYRWRAELGEQTRGEADKYLRKLTRLQARYAMRMPTVADRLAEGFTRPMEIDRIRALVRPAMKELRADGYSPNFEILKDEIAELTRQPTGVGLDVPAWLMALEEELDRATQREPERDYYEELKAVIPQRALSLEETQRTLERWSSRSER